jgi:hypothetical protein
MPVEFSATELSAAGDADSSGSAGPFPGSFPLAVDEVRACKIRSSTAAIKSRSRVEDAFSPADADLSGSSTGISKMAKFCHPQNCRRSENFTVKFD